MPHGEVNKAWFDDRIAEKRSSQRELADFLGMDSSAMSRILSGNRRMHLKEAEGIANFLNAPISEVLKHAGLDVDGKPRSVLLTSLINEKGLIERLKDQKALPSYIIDRAGAALRITEGESIIAAQIRASAGPLAWMDDALVFFKATDRVEDSAIGSIAICRSDDGEQMIARIASARKTGEARVITVTGKTEELALRTATPVVTIIP